VLTKAKDYLRLSGMNLLRIEAFGSGDFGRVRIPLRNLFKDPGIK